MNQDHICDRDCGGVVPFCSCLLIESLAEISPAVRPPGPALLTVTFGCGDVALMSGYDDLTPTLLKTGLKGKLGVVEKRIPGRVTSLILLLTFHSTSD